MRVPGQAPFLSERFEILKGLKRGGEDEGFPFGGEEGVDLFDGAACEGRAVFTAFHGASLHIGPFVVRRRGEVGDVGRDPVEGGIEAVGEVHADNVQVQVVRFRVVLRDPAGVGVDVGGDGGTGLSSHDKRGEPGSCAQIKAGHAWFSMEAIGQEDAVCVGFVDGVVPGDLEVEEFCFTHGG